MKKKFALLLLLFSVVLLQCAENVSPLTSLKNGVYTGYFIRSTPTSKSKPAKVTLLIQDNKYEGTSDSAYPTICRGSYSITGGHITFYNECFFTANFDWSYIIGGTYTMSFQGNEVILTKDYENGKTDTYHLKIKPDMSIANSLE